MKPYRKYLHSIERVHTECRLSSGRTGALRVREFVLALLVCAFCLHTGGVRAETVIHVATIPEGWPPYIINDSSGPAKTTGIMFEVLRTVASRTDAQVKVVEFPEQRAKLHLVKGKLDAFPKCKEWVEDPDLFLWTDPIIAVGETVATRRSGPAMSAKDLRHCLQARVGTVNGFRYPQFESCFASKTLIRMDSSDTVAMLRMLQHGRVDVALVSPHVAKWYIARYPEFKGAFQLSSAYVNDWQYRFAFSKSEEWAEYLKAFNKELRQMRASGELDALIESFISGTSG